MKRIAVFGTGIMGRGIAFAAAQAGIEVECVARNPGSAIATADWLKARVKGLVEKAKLTEDAARELVARVRFAAPVGVMAATNEDLDLAIEAVAEDLELKRRVMREMAARAPRAVLATNTSSLSVTDLAHASGAAERVVGLHFFNPVHAMPLVEVVAPIQVNVASVQAARGFAEQLGKTAILVGDAGGFVVNRALFAMLNEACHLAEEGVASLADIDAGMRGGLAHPMGPFALMDLIGLDICIAILESLAREHGPRFHPAPPLRRHVAAGYLGRKTGRGFFPYV